MNTPTAQSGPSDRAIAQAFRELNTMDCLHGDALMLYELAVKLEATTPPAGARDAVTDAAVSLRGLADVIRRHGTCAPMALEVIAERLEATPNPEANTAAPGVGESLPERLRFTAKDARFHGYEGNAALMEEAADALAAQPAPVDEPDKDYDSEGSGYYQCLIDVEKGIQELALSMGWDTDSSAYEVSRYIESFPVPEKYWKGAHLRYKVETAAPAQPAPVVGGSELAAKWKKESGRLIRTAYEIRANGDSTIDDFSRADRIGAAADAMHDCATELLSARPGGEGAYPVGSDREVLLYLMQQFDGETWDCARCGHAEDTATMDSADYLRRYLAAHPAQAGGVES